MEKIKLEYAAPKNKKIEYKGIEIEIVPYINYAEQVVLINQYIADYFKKEKDIIISSLNYHYLEAETSLKNYLLQLNTNIDISEINNDVYTDSTLWTIITANIANYDSFRELLTRIISDIKEQRVIEQSLGTVISNLVEKAYDLLYKLSSVTPEELESLKKSGIELLQKLEESSIVKDMKTNEFSKKTPRKKRA